MLLSDFYEHLLSFEMRQEQQNKTGFESGSSVNSAFRNNFNNKGGDRARGRGRGRGKGSFNPGRQSANGGNQGGRLSCQVCSKPGHTAMKCYHRFDHTYHEEHLAAVATRPTYNIDTNWYADTGATDHITNNFD